MTFTNILNKFTEQVQQRIDDLIYNAYLNGFAVSVAEHKPDRVFKHTRLALAYALGAMDGNREEQSFPSPRVVVVDMVNDVYYFKETDEKKVPCKVVPMTEDAS